MVPARISMGRRGLVAGLFLSFFLLAVPASAREDADRANARVAGQRAYFAHQFCDVSAERIEEYRLKLRARFSDAIEFDLSWKRGWHNEDRRTIQLRAMRANNPKEYAERVKDDCGRLKWQAENALRRTK